MKLMKNGGILIIIRCKNASHGLRGSSKLKVPIHTHFSRQAILTGKVGHIDLVLAYDMVH